MSRRVPDRAVVPSLGSKPLPGGTATPAGWSFYSTWIECPRRWFLKFYVNLTQGTKPDYFALGSVYHAIHEGVPRTKLEAMHPDYARLYGEAHRLFAARIKQAGSITDVKAREKLFVVKEGPLTGIYTCRLDVLHKDGSARELKTASQLHETDEEAYATNGEVIGELIASGASKVTVDIVSKAKEPEVKIFEVRLDAEKKRAFEQMVGTAAEEIRGNVSGVVGAQVREQPLSKQAQDLLFPKRLPACVTSYGRCPYYNKCWTNTYLGYEVNPNPNNDWKKYLLGGVSGHEGKAEAGKSKR